MRLAKLGGGVVRFTVAGTRHRPLKVYVLAVGITLTMVVGTSRVYLGVHWPTDVLAGWTAGASWSILCWLAAGWLQVHQAIEKETDHGEFL